ncbi:hypothetical protein CROQUDRAFT_668047 [Cronartium quercuum f. sp. fusiforme G11]|uniref:MHYT domain-containing protein n=1 Tax=Cronartium quercuum f. sp. fusiforme G11 TaxID=708437 RepID=A0A9P6NPY7_9BASI|nr:hypothetical protein CROQUDRAFT_668047 [Cronartium quercuum f. sp. fusiforme G11]
MPYTDLDYLSINSSDPHALAEFYQTHPIPSSFNAGVVIASILVSILGAATTLLLLGRRTATSGFRNWALLVLAAITMASVGIWGMHFIGMNMVLQPSPDVSWYIQFNPGFTVLSLFVPMLALVLAFVFVGTGPEALPVEEHEDITDCNKEMKSNAKPSTSIKHRHNPFWIKELFTFLNMRIIIGGILVGGTVALMHYSAGFSASFQREYSAYKLGVSIVLACCASTAALLIFFRFQSQWQSNWWKRLACATVLSTGVCGMHYLGLSGTRWFVPANRVEGFSLGKKSSTVLTIAISVMCFGVCVIALIIILSDFLVTRESRRKARRVVIASATFDKAGRVLVNLDGMLPMAEVGTDLPLKEITQELNPRQTTFQWLYSISWDWTIVDPFIPRIVARSLGLDTTRPKIGIPGLRFSDRKQPGTSHASSKSAAQVSRFKDHCLESTQNLSNELGVPMSKMGILFDTVLRTGTRISPAVHETKHVRQMRNDEESSIFSVAAPAQRQQGIMLFLVRELSGIEPDTTESYLRRGFRFAEPRWLSPILADRAGVPKIEIDGLLEHLKLYAKRGMKPCVRSGGTYLGFFAVRPSISREGGIDTLVYQFARHQIPAYRLPDVPRITDEMRAWVVSVSGRSMKEVGEVCVKEANKELGVHKQGDEMWIFKSSLLLAMDALTTSMTMFQKLPERSYLSAEIVEVPSSGDDSTSTASMVVFQAAFPAPMRHGYELPGLSLPHEVSGTYQRQDPMPTFTFVPYTLFSKSQMMLLRGSSARKFAKKCRSDLMKRYAISPEALQAYTASPQDHSPTGMGNLLVDLGHSDQIEKQEELHDEEYDDSPTHLDLRFGESVGTPAQIEAQAARRRASVMSGMTGNSTPSSLQHTILFDENLGLQVPVQQGFQPMNVRPTENGQLMYTNFRREPMYEDPAVPLISPHLDAHSMSVMWRSPESEGVAAPAYSPIRASDFSGSPTRSSHGMVKHSQLLQNTLLPLPTPRPQTATDPPLRPSRNPRASTSSGVVSGRRVFSGPAALENEYFPTVPLSPVTEFVTSQPLSATSAHQPYRSAPVLCSPIARPTPQPLAITARLRSDDWYSRCMDALENSPAGQELLGVDW